MFPDIKASIGIDTALKLKADLKLLKHPILDFVPRSFDSRRLNTIRFRIYPFPRNENCNEYFITIGKRKYVCLNANLLKRKYFTGLQHLLHGIAHSFCYLRDEIAQEAFAEFVSYSILKKFANLKGENFARRILKSAMNASKKEYNSYFRAARKLEERKPAFLIKLNTKAKNRKISKKKERKIFYKLLKNKLEQSEDEKIPDLEKNFVKV